MSDEEVIEKLSKVFPSNCFSIPTLFFLFSFFLSFFSRLKRNHRHSWRSHHYVHGLQEDWPGVLSGFVSLLK